MSISRRWRRVRSDRREVPRPVAAARAPPPSRHRPTGGGAQGAASAREDGRHRRCALAPHRDGTRWHGRIVQGACHLPTQARSSLPDFQPSDMMIEANTLALPGIRHAFFTRRGGVSDGVYASLNGGIGSRDGPAQVADNRARMAAALGVEPDRLLTAHQIHSPHVVVARRRGRSKRARAPTPSSPARAGLRSA